MFVDRDYQGPDGVTALAEQAAKADSGNIFSRWAGMDQKSQYYGTLKLEIAHVLDDPNVTPDSVLSARGGSLDAKGMEVLNTAVAEMRPRQKPLVAPG